MDIKVALKNALGTIQSHTTAANYQATDLVPLFDSNDQLIGKISRNELMSAVKTSLGTLLNLGAADLGTSLAKIPALNSGGTLGSATVANLASVLGDNNFYELPENTDFDTVSYNGVCFLNGRTFVNAPESGVIRGFLFNSKKSTTMISQFVITGYPACVVYRRTNWNGTWRSWEQIYDTSLLTNSTMLGRLASALGVDKRFEFVDMGLPSGTLWASKNLGADTITDYGAYFSWGNVQGQKPNGTTFPQTWGRGNDTEPYVSSEGAALTGDIPLNLDAANYYLGGKAKMPTKDQFVELFNSSYTTNAWTTLHGVAGILVTSKANGNTIFFPAAGYGNGSSLYYAGSVGSYWSRSLQSSTNGYYLYFDDNSSVSPQNGYTRYFGVSVRAVL